MNAANELGGLLWCSTSTARQYFFSRGTKDSKLHPNGCLVAPRIYDLSARCILLNIHGFQTSNWIGMGSSPISNDRLELIFSYFLIDKSAITWWNLIADKNGCTHLRLVFPAKKAVMNKTWDGVGPYFKGSLLYFPKNYGSPTIFLHN